MKPAVLSFTCMLLAVALGCSKNEPAPAPPADAAPAPAPPPVTGASTAPVAPAPAAPRAIATADGTTPGTRVEVLELKRTSGGTVTLRFAIVNESRQTLDVSAVLPLLNLGDAYSVANLHLIDAVGRKKYFTAQDSEGKCVCSKYAFVEPGQRGNHWAKLPAPPDDVERLSVVIPPFAPMDDVPVSR